METMATTLLHGYTHLPDLVKPALEGPTIDHPNGYGFYNSCKLDKSLSKTNAGNYAAFATELMWSKLCSRDFDAPVKNDAY
jgi:hypothetical protein